MLGKYGKSTDCRNIAKYQPDESLQVQGWVRTKRESKGFAFIEVNDGSSLANLQVVINQDLPDYEAILKKLNTGAAVEATGVLVASLGKGQRIELKAETVKVYGEADPDTYPLQKKRHSFEFLRTIGHLRSRTNSLVQFSASEMLVRQQFTIFSKKEGFYGYTPLSSLLATVKAQVNCLALPV